jgi:hypothetical protein
MKPPFRSLYGQMIFVLLTGSQILFVPNVILSIFGVENTNEIWIRVLGLLVFALSIYYYYLAKHGNLILAWATIYTRVFFCSGLAIFALLGLIKPILLLLPFVEGGLAFWTYQEIKTMGK